MDLLTGVIRHYDWGHHRALSEILGHAPPGHPEAEYWLGAHPSAPSRVGHEGRLLDGLVAEQPEEFLGPTVADNFGGVPFLLKVLAAAKPLSIQAHPTLEQAEAGFARENEAGIDLGAGHRNYRDPNHKPELICALTPFEGKCGFRPLGETRRLVALFQPELDDLARRLDGTGAPAELVAEAVVHLLRLEPAVAGPLAEAVVARAQELLAVEETTDEVARFRSELAWTVRIGDAFPTDIGVVVALLMNHVVLEPGQAIFLPAGNIHAYLEGVGVELMATSDNVLRGGLTTKHVDVDELLAVVDWEPSPVPVQTADGAIHRFDVPVPEFDLIRLDASRGPIAARIDPSGPEIVLVTQGRLALEGVGRSLEVGTGQAVLLGPIDGVVRLSDLAPGHTLAWRATAGSA